MKAKVNFDSTRMKQFFVDHGEKLGLGALTVAAGLIVSAGLKVKGYDEAPHNRTPELLKQDVNAARQNLQTSDRRMNLPQAGVRPPDEDFITTIDKRLLQPIQGAKFGGIEWNRPLFDTKQRRTEPVYLAAEELRTSFHYGAITFGGAGGNPPPGASLAGAGQNPGAGGSVRGEEWICVTAVVPIEAQAAAHRKAFQNALDPNRNAVPIYRTYALQRAELAPGQTPETANWDAAKTFDLAGERDAVVTSWSKLGNEVADATFVKAPLTQPVPPVADPIIGEWAAHLPQVPLATVDAAAAVAAPGALQPLRPQQPGQPAAPQTLPKYYLFRFFDFDVAPTKQYCYRLKLVLENPNFGLDLAHLEKPDLAQGETRETPWSKTSTAVRVPILEWLMAGAVGPLNGDSEPDGNVAVKTWVQNFGAESFYEFEAKFRGAMLNNPVAEVHHRVPGTGSSSKQPHNLQTGALLADFAFERGDARFKTADGRPINRPAEMLLLTAGGELQIHSQLMDWTQWEEFKRLVAGGAVAPAGGDAPRGLFGPVVPAAPAPAPAGGGLRLQLK